MKNSKWMWVVLAIGLAVGCQRSVGASLLGTCEQIAAEQNGTYEPQTMEDQLMVLVAKDIAATLPGGSDYVSPIVSDPACVPTGVITYTTAVVFVPAADELSVTTYTVHGVPVVVTVEKVNSGGEVDVLHRWDGNCLTNSAYFGSLAIEGKFTAKWTIPETGVPITRLFKYNTEFFFNESILYIDGSYTYGGLINRTHVPFHYRIDISGCGTPAAPINAARLRSRIKGDVADMGSGR